VSITITWEINQNNLDPEGGDLQETTVNGLVIDVVTRMTAIFSAEVSERPSEVGAPHTDSTRRDLKKYNLECSISEHPRDASEVGATIKSVDLSSGKSASLLVYEDEQYRIGRATQALESLVGATEVSIDGLLTEVDGWIIQRFEPVKEANQAGVMNFTLDIIEIQKAELTEIEAPSPLIERGRRRRDRGAHNPTATPGTSSSATPAAGTSNSVSNEPANRGSALHNIRQLSQASIRTGRDIANIMLGRRNENDPNTPSP
jgi:hypothetical protein